MEKRVIEVKENENKRLDAYISEVDEKLSRTTVKRLLDEGKILVNGKFPKASYKVSANDKIEIEIPEVKETKLEAQDIPVPVIYEDNDIIVVNKPKGMVVHPANGNPDGTLVNAILSMCKGSLSGIGGEIRPGIVHRLDKDTSGLMLVAKNEETHEKLSKMIGNKEVERRYLAITTGVIKTDTGTIDAPIGRDQRNRLKMQVTDVNAKEAITHFKVLKRYKANTLIECILETGRTHQIRVHLAYINYPIVNDPLYGKEKNCTEFGQMLHSKSIRFNHPRTNKELYFEVEPPKEFKEKLEELENEE